MFVALTINCKCPVKEVLCSSDDSTDHGQSSAAVFVLFIGFAQQLRLEVAVILAPSAVTQTLVKQNNRLHLK